MDAGKFSTESPGRLIKIPPGNAGLSHAFIPNPLPPGINLTAELWPILVEARAALADLNGTGKHLPSPELILRPLQNREAQKSSSLEGTITDPTQQVLFEADIEEEETRSPVESFKEVANYKKALRLSRGLRNELPLCSRLVRRLHEALLSEVRGQEKNPGHFRKNQNYIGKPPRYVPPPPTELPSLLSDLDNYLNAEHKLDPLIEAFLVHYQFEAIHPFIDGNGRVGRVLLALLVKEWCKLSDQWLYMSDYFDRNKDDYIDRLFEISTRGDWLDWIEFCLKGVIEQAKDTSNRCDRLIQLRSDYHNRVKSDGGSVRLLAIVDNLFVSPVAIVSRTAEEMGVTYPTARADLKRLDHLGIIAEFERANQITYLCNDILRITYVD